MKKIYALFISGLIALCFSVSLQAQSSKDPERDKWQKPEEVVKNLNLKPGDVVADIGAGTGYFTRYFAIAVNPGGKALGLDINPSPG